MGRQSENGPNLRWVYCNYPIYKPMLRISPLLYVALSIYASLFCSLYVFAVCVFALFFCICLLSFFFFFPPPLFCLLKALYL